MREMHEILEQLVDDVNAVSVLENSLWFQVLPLPAIEGCVTVRESYTCSVWTLDPYDAAKQVQKTVYEFIEQRISDEELAISSCDCDEGHSEYEENLELLRKNLSTLEIIFEYHGLTRCL